MKQKIFSWKDRFSVCDQNGIERYSAVGEVFTWGKKLHLYDLSGREVAFIEQKVLSFLPRFFITCEGVQLAQVVREFTFFRSKYSVIGPDWTVDGDFFGREYQITSAEGVVATVSKEWLSWGDTYKISVPDGKDEVTALAVVLVIDACIDI